MLSWLTEHETNTAERAQTVAAFVDLHQQSDTFTRECTLMRPILEGGIILYVVDASRPPSVKEEAEMETDNAAASQEAKPKAPSRVLG